MRTDKTPITLSIDDYDDFESVLICAIRYSLGRRTYMPSVVTNFIMRNCKGQLSDKFLRIMIKEIEECPYYGDDCDKEDWMKFLSWMKNEHEN